MAKKISQWTPKGMNQDLSVSKFNPEFTFENMNLRLSTNEGNTMMSWVNERGPEGLIIELFKPWETNDGIITDYIPYIPGMPLGYAVISHTLVLFTKDESENKDYIIILEKKNDITFEGKFLFEGNLDFDLTYPIETHVSFEEDDIQKVYWTDGKNQPRMINIKVDDKKINLWHDKAEELGGTCTFFNFSPNTAKGDISVEKINSGGLFAPGVIQYAFTYVNKHGQQSNIMGVSDLHYISNANRGVSPEESVNNSFEVIINTEEHVFDFIRLYSIQRTSLDGVVIAKLLADLDIVHEDTTKNVTETKSIEVLNRKVTPPVVIYDNLDSYASQIKLNDPNLEEITFNLYDKNNVVKTLSLPVYENEVAPAWIDNIESLNKILSGAGTNGDIEACGLGDDWKNIEEGGVETCIKGIYIKDVMGVDSSGNPWPVKPTYYNYKLKEVALPGGDKLCGPLTLPRALGALSKPSTHDLIIGNTGTQDNNPYKGFFSNSSTYIPPISTVPQLQSLLFYVRKCLEFLENKGIHYLSDDNKEVHVVYNYDGGGSVVLADEHLVITETIWGKDVFVIPWVPYVEVEGSGEHSTEKITEDSAEFPSFLEIVFSYVEGKFELNEVVINKQGDLPVKIASDGNYNAAYVIDFQSSFTRIMIKFDKGYNERVLGNSWYADWKATWGNEYAPIDIDVTPYGWDTPLDYDHAWVKIPASTPNNLTVPYSTIMYWDNDNSSLYIEVAKLDAEGSAPNVQFGNMDVGYGTLEFDSDSKENTLLGNSFQYTYTSEDMEIDGDTVKVYKCTITTIPGAEDIKNWLHDGLTFLSNTSVNIVMYKLKYMAAAGTQVVQREDAIYSNWLVYAEGGESYKVLIGSLSPSTKVVHPDKIQEGEEEGLYIYNNTQYRKATEYDDSTYVINENISDNSYYYIHRMNVKRENPNCIDDGGYFLDSLVLKYKDVVGADKKELTKTISTQAISSFADIEEKPVYLNVFTADESNFIIASENRRTGSDFINYFDDLLYFKVPSNSYYWDESYKRDISYDAYFIDNGTIGSSIDPTELLYIGGKEITALTMADKDGTLFLGNITQKNSNVAAIQQYVDANREALIDKLKFKNDGEKSLNNNSASGTYYTNTLRLDKSDKEITTFKGGETYRLGFQLQKKNGEWSEPIYLCDKENDKYPSSNSDSSQLYLPYAEGSLDISGIREQIQDFDNIYTRIRPVVVYPSITDRSVLCQGVINPTVFNAEDRVTNSPYAQASWFFRPYSYKEEEKEPLVNMSKGESTDDWDIVKNYTESWSINRYCIVRAVFNVAYEGWKRDEVFMTIVQNWVPYNNGGAFKVNNENYCFIVQAHYLDFFIAILKGSTYGYMVKEVWAPCDMTWKYNAALVRGMKEEEHKKINNLASFDKFKINTFGKDVEIETYLHEDNGDGTFTKFTFKFPAQMITEGEGSIVGFTHYKSLITQEDAAGNVHSGILIYGDRPKQIEIQGSVKSYFSYDSPKRTDWDVNSNTQFFVDQSILTLNSPDVEYDTEVQTYSMEEVKMRIIGAIPIQATASSHQIRISTPTLSTYYNTEGAHIYGEGDRKIDVRKTFANTDADRRLVSEFNWNDAFFHKRDDSFITWGLNNFIICPWNKVGSLNNDFRDFNQASAKLNIKKMSNLLYSYNTDYFCNHKEVIKTRGIDVPTYQTYDDFPDISAKVHLRENEGLINYILSAPKDGMWTRNYYPNIYKTLYNSSGYRVLDREMGTVTHNDEPLVYNTIEMRYKSNSHVIISTGKYSKTSSVIKLPLYGWNGEDVGRFSRDNASLTFNTFWGENNLEFYQDYADMTKLFNGEKYGWLWLAELYKDVQNRFGGTSENALKTNKWNVAGETVDIPSGSDNVVLRWTKGDTYYQRYDCMKTYAYSLEDPNQMVEMLSFMCETHVNLDGIYDKDRGTIIAYNLNPNNFGHLNYVYSQRDNFFTTLNRKINWDTKETNVYPNILTYTKTKVLGADIDNWTNITLASTLDLDGDKGLITSLNRFNNEMIAFQETGISQILYNESAQISTTAGVPVELGNSGKVQGKRYISDTIGCANKWSIAPTPSGLYFMDSYDRGIYRYSGKLENISAALGFNSWCKINIHKTKEGWNPKDFEDFVAYYDKNNQDVLFINKDCSLAFSEKFGVFTSFYDYGNTPYFCNFEDTGIWLKPEEGNTALYEHQKGLYCNFFRKPKPYWMTLVGNPEPITDKIFTNLEFRANVNGEGTEIEGKYSPTLPFDSLEAWDEYQHGYLDLSLRNSSADRLHSSLQRKFRMWRCDIPRDNVPALNDSVIFDKPYTADSKLGITRFNRHVNDRMRNPWIYLKLTKDAATDNNALPRAEIHDLVMTYYN